MNNLNMNYSPKNFRPLQNPRSPIFNTYKPPEMQKKIKVDSTVYDDEFIGYVNDLTDIIKVYYKATRHNVNQSNNFVSMLEGLSNSIEMSVQELLKVNDWNKFQEIFDTIEKLKKIKDQLDINSKSNDKNLTRFFEDAKGIFKNMKTKREQNLVEFQKNQGGLGGIGNFGNFSNTPERTSMNALNQSTLSQSSIYTINAIISKLTNICSKFLAFQKELNTYVYNAPELSELQSTFSGLLSELNAEINNLYKLKEAQKEPQQNEYKKKILNYAYPRSKSPLDNNRYNTVDIDKINKENREYERKIVELKKQIMDYQNQIRNLKQVAFKKSAPERDNNNMFTGYEMQVQNLKEKNRLLDKELLSKTQDINYKIDLINSLQERIKEMSQKYLESKGERDTKEILIKNLQTEKNIYQKKVEDLNKIIKNNENIINNKLNMVKNYKDQEIEDIRNKLNLTQLEYQKVYEELINKRDENDQVKNDNETLNLELIEIKKTIKNYRKLEQENNQLKRQLEKHNFDSKRILNDQGNYEKKLKEKEMEIQNIQNENENNKQMINKYKTKLKELNNKFETKQNEYETELALMTDKNTALSKFLTTKNKEIITLQQDNIEKTSELEKAKGKLKYYENQVSQKNEEDIPYLKTEMNNQRITLRKQLEEKEKSINNLKDNMSNFETKNLQLAKEIDGLEEKIKKFQEENEELKMIIDDLNDEKTDLINQLQELNQGKTESRENVELENQKLRNENNKLFSQYNQLLNSFNDKNTFNNLNNLAENQLNDQAYNEMINKYNELEKKFEGYSEELTKKVQELNECKLRNSELEMENKKLKDDNKRNDSTNQFKMKKLEDLVEKQKNELIKKQKLIETHKNENEKLNDIIQSNKDNDLTIAELNEEISALQKKNQELEEEKVKIIQEKSTEIKLNNLAKDYDEKLNKINSLNKELEDNRNTFGKNSQKIKMLEDLNNKYKVQIDELNTTVINFNKMIEDKDNFIRKLQSQIRDQNNNINLNGGLNNLNNLDDEDDYKKLKNQLEIKLQEIMRKEQEFNEEKENMLKENNYLREEINKMTNEYSEEVKKMSEENENYKIKEKKYEDQIKFLKEQSQPKEEEVSLNEMVVKDQIIEDKEEEIKKLNALIENYKQEMNNMDEKHREEMNNFEEKYKEDIGLLQEQLENAPHLNDEEEEGNLLEELYEIKNRNSELQNDNERLNKEVALLKEKIISNNEELEKIKNDNNINIYGKKESNATDKDDEVRLLKEEKEKLKKDAALQELELQKLKKDIDYIKKQKDIVDKKYEEEKELNEELNEEKKGLTAKTEDLQNQINDLEQQIYNGDKIDKELKNNNNSEEIEGLKQTIFDLNQKRQNEEDNHTIEKNEMLKQIDDLQKENANYLKQIQHLTDDYNDEMGRLKRQIDNLTKKYKNAKEGNNNVSKISANSGKNQNESGIFGKLNESTKSKNTEKEKEKLNKTGGEIPIEKYKNILSELNSANRQVTQLQDQNQKLKNQLEQKEAKSSYSGVNKTEDRNLSNYEEEFDLKKIANGARDKNRSEDINIDYPGFQGIKEKLKEVENKFKLLEEQVKELLINITCNTKIKPMVSQILQILGFNSDDINKVTTNHKSKKKILAGLPC